MFSVVLWLQQTKVSTYSPPSRLLTFKYIVSLLVSAYLYAILKLISDYELLVHPFLVSIAEYVVH